MDRRQTSLETLLANKPKLHFWHDQWQLGGMSDQHLRHLHQMAIEDRPSGPAKILETGAGLSTLAFLTAQPARLTTICPDAKLASRVRQQAEKRGIDASALDFQVARSELALPRLAEPSEQDLDIALIDGEHGYPTVFVDFCYINMMLRRGGKLLIDDLQIHSVRELFLALRNQRDWEVQRIMGKLAILEKKTDERFMPMFGQQPYISRNAVTTD